MERHLCPSCGAPLPVGAPGTIQRCRFCEAETREEPPPPLAEPPAPLAPPAAPAFVPRFEPPPSIAPPRGPSTIIPYFGILVGVLVALVVVGQAVYRSASTADVRGAIGTTTLTRDWQAIDVTGMPVDARFDPFGQLGWVGRVAAGWRHDAILVNLHATEVGSDGLMTLSASSWVEYFFQSQDSEKCSHHCALDVLVDAASGKPRVRFAEFDVGTAQLPLSARCALPDAFAALAKNRPVPSRSTYDVRLVDWSRSPFVALPKWEMRASTDDGSRVGILRPTTAPLDVGSVDATSCVPGSPPAPSATSSAYPAPLSSSAATRRP
ncbi:MAG TPA: hypothetical protein VIJ22_00475 [Polyangiaceae bacterium]